MEKIEYRDVLDKADWPRGAWDSEPDKVQWPDEATGLPCVAVRGPGGHWCGYVGVPAGHPLHGVSYSSCRYGDKCPEKKGDESYSYCGHRPESFLNAHGGITFAGGCADVTPEKWRKFREHLGEHTKTAKTYPKGDSAQWIKEWSPIIDNYEAWADRQRARNVCHLPAPGEPDHVWWFGFDCAHAGDKSPAYGRLSPSFNRGDDVYRDLAYVQGECRRIAQQLASVSQ